MIILDPGHIYKIEHPFPILLRFIKRGGGAIQYSVEWPGIQTQAVMRALIDYLEQAQLDYPQAVIYPLFQLGTSEPYPLYLFVLEQIPDLINVLIDRSLYLNGIISCSETQDACHWLEVAKEDLNDMTMSFEERCNEACHNLRMALWCYEARAYRRKQEQVNREKPTHDNSARMTAWRYFQVDDIPFNEDYIEQRPIGLDGHIVLGEHLSCVQ